MILFFLINKILACDFTFTPNENNNWLYYTIPQVEFTAFGIWTRYYAFYNDISTIEKIYNQYYE